MPNPYSAVASDTHCINSLKEAVNPLVLSHKALVWSGDSGPHRHSVELVLINGLEQTVADCVQRMRDIAR